MSIIHFLTTLSAILHMGAEHTRVYQLYPDSDRPRDLDIVFFHGLQSTNENNAWEATWKNADDICWPRDWLPHHKSLADTDVRVLSVSYNAQLSEYVTGDFDRTADGHMSISEPLFQALVRWSVGTVPLVLVGHSYGGVVIKSLVVYGKQNADTADTGNLLQNLRGVVSYGVPHLGPNLAAHRFRLNSILPLRLAKLVYGLEPFDRDNERLCEQFKVAIQNRGFRGLGVKRFAFAEHLKTNGIMVVKEASAKWDHRGIEEFLVLQKTDHYTMCKPRTKSAEAYVHFVKFLADKIIAADPALRKDTRAQASAPPYQGYGY